MILNVPDEKVCRSKFEFREEKFFTTSFFSFNKGIFPEPEHDPVIQIASMVIRQGEKEEFIKTVFTLGTCANIAGVGVIECHTEQELLEVRRRNHCCRFTLIDSFSSIRNGQISFVKLILILLPVTIFKILTFPIFWHVQNI